MMSRTGVNKIECKNIDQFLKKIRPATALFDGAISSTVLFRGVSNAKYELVPTALRTDPSTKLLIDRIKSLTPEDPNYIVDVTILRLFYQEANRNGLALPPLPQSTHDELTTGAVGSDMKGRMFRELLPVFALAQHYGLPTRLLDWSFDPLIAAYFAASGGTYKLSKENPDGAKEIGVWLIQSKFIHNDVRIVHAPYNSNPNLAAQKGAFTFVHGVNDPTPLNVHSSSGSNPRKDFHLITLPIDQSPCLLLELRILGYDAGRIFPGYGGITSCIRELAELPKFPQVKKKFLTVKI